MAMNSIKTAAVLLLVMMLSSCGGLTIKDTDRWLENKNSPSTIDMTGEWDSGGSWAGGWGTGRFIQDGRNFSGTLGSYYAEGTVSGDHVYMVIYSRKKVYYTAILKQTDDSYMGKAVYETLADDREARHAQSYPIVLKKVTR